MKLGLSSVIIGTIILAVLSIIIASAWNNLIEKVLSYYFPQLGNEILPMVMYVIIMTIILILAASYFIPKFDREYKLSSC